MPTSYWLASVTLPCLVFGSFTDASEAMITESVQNEHSAAAGDVTGDDSIRLPPPTRRFASPNGQFIFVVQSTDEWKSKYAEGRLYQRGPTRKALLWERGLPQEYGPRYVLVGNQGQVLLLDEWINVKSKYAVFLRNHQKLSELSYPLEKVVDVLGVPVATIVNLAKNGWWIAGPPTLDTTGSAAIVPTAGKHLRIDLDTGMLSVF